MRIDRTYLLPISVGSAGGPAGSEETAMRPETLGNMLSQPGFHTPSPELSRWINLAREQPEIRPEVIRQVVQRLASGQYFTPSSADKTASAILREASS